MPIVTPAPVRAPASASRTQPRKAAAFPMTWSAANEPMTAPGWRRSSTAAARAIAAIESRGGGFRARVRLLEAGQLGADGVRVQHAGDPHDVVAAQRREPVPCGLQQR